MENRSKGEGTAKACDMGKPEEQRGVEFPTEKSPHAPSKAVKLWGGGGNLTIEKGGIEKRCMVPKLG